MEPVSNEVKELFSKMSPKTPLTSTAAVVGDRVMYDRGGGAREKDGKAIRAEGIAKDEDDFTPYQRMIFRSKFYSTADYVRSKKRDNSYVRL